MRQEETIDILIKRYEALTKENIDSLLELYTPGAYFKDPFNEVRGKDAIKHIFLHMFKQIEFPRFKVISFITKDNKSCLLWEFHIHEPDSYAPNVIHGCTWLILDKDGLIAEHRDYWDAAEELYEKLPILGSFMRWLKRRISAN
jgi:predicted SnoaL-like aldol condensation-catalyzing enzyme